MHALGKPAPAIYDAAMQLLDVTDPKQVVAIGDSLIHDIAGAVPLRFHERVQPMFHAFTKRGRVATVGELKDIGLSWQAHRRPAVIVCLWREASCLRSWGQVPGT